MKTRSILTTIAAIAISNLAVANNARAVVTPIDPPAIAAVYVNDTKYVFGRGTDSQIFTSSWGFGGFGSPLSPSPWAGLGGTFNSAPTAVSWYPNDSGPDRIDVFALDTNYTMQHKSFFSNAWHPSSTTWEALGGVFHSQPAVVSWGPNRLDIFALGTDNQMFHKAWTGTAWAPSQTGWDALGGVFKTMPAVVSWGPNRFDLFGVGTDNAMYHKAWVNGWSPSQTTWEALGGYFAQSSPPAVTSWGPNRIDIFEVGNGNALYHKSWDGGGWRPSQTGPWESHGGSFQSQVSVSSWGSNRLDIFGVGQDYGMYHQAWNGNWVPSLTGYENHAGNFESMPTSFDEAIVLGSDNPELDVFGINTADGSIYNQNFNWTVADDWGPNEVTYLPWGGKFLPAMATIQPPPPPAPTMPAPPTMPPVPPPTLPAPGAGGGAPENTCGQAYVVVCPDSGFCSTEMGNYCTLQQAATAYNQACSNAGGLCDCHVATTCGG